MVLSITGDFLQCGDERGLMNLVEIRGRWRSAETVGCGRSAKQILRQQFRSGRLRWEGAPATPGDSRHGQPAGAGLLRRRPSALAPIHQLVPREENGALWRSPMPAPWRWSRIRWTEVRASASVEEMAAAAGGRG